MYVQARALCIPYRTSFGDTELQGSLCLAATSCLLYYLPFVMLFVRSVYCVCLLFISVVVTITDPIPGVLEVLESVGGITISVKAEPPPPEGFLALLRIYADTATGKALYIQPQRVLVCMWGGGGGKLLYTPEIVTNIANKTKK